STKRWRVNGKSLPWFSDQAKEITGDMDDWCKKEKSFTLHLEHDYPLKHLGLCTANEDVDKSNMGFFVVQDDFSHFLTFVFVPFLKNFWGFGKDNLGQITLARLKDISFSTDAYSQFAVPTFQFLPLQPLSPNKAGRWKTLLQWRYTFSKKPESL